LLVAGLLDAAEGFGTEVRSGDEVVGEAQEVGENWKSGLVVRGKLDGEADTLARLGIFEAAECQSRYLDECGMVLEIVGLTSWAGPSADRSQQAPQNYRQLR
jgi:hypothetical protein